MVLPILTFDEHALSPRFGYVVDAHPELTHPARLPEGALICG